MSFLIRNAFVNKSLLGRPSQQFLVRQSMAQECNYTSFARRRSTLLRWSRWSALEAKLLRRHHAMIWAHYQSDEQRFHCVVVVSDGRSFAAISAPSKSSCASSPTAGGRRSGIRPFCWSKSSMTCGKRRRTEEPEITGSCDGARHLLRGPASRPRSRRSVASLMGIRTACPAERRVRTILVLQGDLDGVTRLQLGVFACDNPFRSFFAFSDNGNLRFIANSPHEL
jgi:hypothetical protein